ncbi:MAG: Fe-S cluster assembly ATPase SufC [bacterium]
MTTPQLIINNLHASTEGKEILKGISLTINGGEIHAIMGPNGSGKSTLSNCIMGHPSYEITAGTITLDGKNVLEMSVDERAKAGLFLSFQYPTTITGVPLANFLHTAYNELHWNGERDKLGKKKQAAPYTQFYKTQLLPAAQNLDADESFIRRSVNDGLSGGEKKKSEILQLAVLKPKIAILDETDSGLDIDSIRIVAKGVKKIFEEQQKQMGVLVITHYQRILQYLEPDFVHVMVDGKIVESGKNELVEKLEKSGYSTFQTNKTI